VARIMTEQASQRELTMFPRCSRCRVETGAHPGTVSTRAGVAEARFDCRTCCRLITAGIPRPFRRSVQQQSTAVPPLLSALQRGTPLSARLNNTAREPYRHFASKGLGVRVPLAPLSALVRGTLATQEPLTRPEYSSKYSNVSGNGLVQLTKAYDSGLEFLPEACAVVAGLSPKTRGHRVHRMWPAATR
jgi:hypothetical protein